MPESISFGTWLRQKRRSLDLTQKAFADQIGCAEITVRRMEADGYKPSRELALTLFEKLGIPEPERSQWISFARGMSSLPGKSIPRPNKPTSNLPVSLTSFIGREKEQQEVVGLIDKRRLMTLIGSGGVGKTRLSLKVGEQVLANYDDGVWFVELAPILDPLLVPRTVAIALGLPDEPQRPIIDMLCDYLREKKMLIILDNCEHLLEACAHLTDTLLKRCPSLKILVTSREALGILGEAIYRVPSLGLPKLQPILDTFRNYESIQLFEERAQLVQFDFSLTRENASSVAQICHRLDGIPLAIELAAAKVGVFSTEQIAKQLDESFNVLAGGRRTDLPHHQTLRASIEWSWNLLTESEQRLMRQISVFTGGWTLEAARAVCVGDVLEMSNSLAKKSLIVINQEMGHETRYRFHETIRQYANERLLESGETDLLRERHLNYFLRLAEEAELKLRGAEQIDWLNRLKVDHDNLRAALAWALSGNVETGLRLAGAVWWFWRMSGYVREGCEWMSKILASPNAMLRTRMRAKALHGAAFLETIQHNPAKAQALFEESLALYTDLGDKHGVAIVLNGLGFLARRQRDWKAAPIFFDKALKIGWEIGNKHVIAGALEELGLIARRERNWVKARSIFEQFLAIEHELKNTTQIAKALFRLGSIDFAQGDVSVARARFEESLGLYRELDSKQFIAISLNELGNVARYEGDYEQASALYHESLNLFQEEDVGFKNDHATVLSNMAFVAYHQGYHDRAREFFEESLRLYRKLEEEEGSALCLVGIAGILASMQKLEKAVTIISVARTVFDIMDTELTPPDQADYEHILAVVRTQLDVTTFTAAWIKGHAIRLEQAIAYAFANDASVSVRP
jgi:predicted ATPase/DNA-binding XRE family transcriptional regulator